MKTKSILYKILMLAFVLFAGAFIGNTVGEPILGMVGALTLSLVAGIANVAKAGGYAFSIITGTPFTFNGKEATSAIIEPAYDTPEITEFMTIVEGIVAKEQIAFLGRLTKVTKIDDGCGTGASNKTVPATEKFWDPVAVKFWLTQCETDLERTFFVWGTKNGIDRYDLTATDFMTYVMEVLIPAVKEDALRLLWFGDKAVDTIANASFLNDAADIPFYNAINGFWKQIYVAVAATKTVRVTITENAGNSYVNQALPAGAAYNYLLAMYEQADPRLLADPNAYFGVSQSMYNNWLSTKESKQFDTSFARQDKAYNQDVFRGIPLYVMNFWDRNINADMNNGTVRVLPHRAIMTTKTNLMVGMDSSTAASQVDVFFNKETEINHMKGGYKVDAIIAQEFMVIAAY